MYTAWGTVSWDWFGETRSAAALATPPQVSTTFSAADSYGDRVYNLGTSAYLGTTAPPLSPPVAPTGVTAYPSAVELGESVVLRLVVDGVPAPETAKLLRSSSVTAAPVGSSAPIEFTTPGRDEGAD